MEQKELQAVRELLDSAGDINHCTQVLNRVAYLVGGLLEAGNRMALGLGQDPDEEQLPPVKQFFDQIGISFEMVNEFHDALRLVGISIDRILKVVDTLVPTIQ